MGRHREFDEDDVLERALDLFWTKGYRDTKLRDLAAHTGVANAGLYSAFKGKDGLFDKALDMYAKSQVKAMFGPLEEDGAGAHAISQFFDALADGIATGRFARGCFVANTAVELGATHAVIGTRIARIHERELAAFRNAVHGAKREGSLPKSSDERAMAAMFLSGFHGLSTLARAGGDRDVLVGACRQFADMVT